MTRRRIIAGVILLAAVAVLAAPGVWERVAYVVEVPVPKKRRYGFKSRPGTLPAHPVRTVESNTMTVMRKRHAWLPGQTFIVPDQVCPPCDFRHHRSCFPRHQDGARCQTQDGTWVDLPDDFRCTCTDPSHDGDSE